MHLSTRATLSALLSAIVAGAAFLGAEYLLGALALTALVFASGWPYLLSIRSPLTATFLITLTGVGALSVVYIAPGVERLVWVPVVLASGVLLAFVNELAQTRGRPNLVFSLTSVVSGLVIVTGLSGWLALLDGKESGQSLIVTAAGALALSSAISAVDLGRWGRPLATVLAGSVFGAVMGMGLPEIDRIPAAVIGLIAGVLVAAGVANFVGIASATKAKAAVGLVALPVAMMGIMVYGAGRVLL